MSALYFSVHYQGTSFSVPYESDPGECPLCHHSVAPELRNATLVSGAPQSASSIIDVAYLCTNRSCNHLFIATYDTPGGIYSLVSLAPVNFLGPVVPPEIQEVAPSFQRIYAQAAEAEARGLDEIAGMGFRKALEFLVKEFLFRDTSPEEKTKISAEKLSVSIANRVDDPKLRISASRAAWLGNDETHYVRRWQEKDIGDLKILIRLTMHWIGSSVLTKHYETTMPKP